MADIPTTAVLKQLSRINDKLDQGFGFLGQKIDASNAKLDRLVEGQDRIVETQERMVELLEAQVEMMRPKGTASHGWPGGQLEGEGTELA